MGGWFAYAKYFLNICLQIIVYASRSISTRYTLYDCTAVDKYENSQSSKKWVRIMNSLVFFINIQ